VGVDELWMVVSHQTPELLKTPEIESGGSVQDVQRDPAIQLAGHRASGSGRHHVDPPPALVQAVGEVDGDSLSTSDRKCIDDVEDRRTARRCLVSTGQAIARRTG